MKRILSFLLVLALSGCAEVFTPQVAPSNDASPRDPGASPPVVAPQRTDPQWLAWLREQQYRLELGAKPPATVLRVPVRGVNVRQIANTFGAPRGGGRVHEGLDIFARAGTPVVSATGGIVVRVGTNNLGGLVVYTLGAGGRIYYYAHLSRYGAFEEGDIIKPGDVLGYVGNTGNARGTPPHLHFGVYDTSEGWEAVNPFPKLRDD
jgi:murein DD-endopeptidase MepM/ murein hydrolase activator NlpD